jgi:tryptophan synthase alpha chain
VHIPVGVGFGIRDAATAKTIGKVADAVVIGSKLLQLIAAAPAGKATDEARLFMHGIREALDSV